MIPRLLSGALAALLMATLAPSAHAQKSLVVTEPTHGVGYLPLYIAIRNGYFAKEAST